MFVLALVLLLRICLSLIFVLVLPLALFISLVGLAAFCMGCFSCDPCSSIFSTVSDLLRRIAPLRVFVLIKASHLGFLSVCLLVCNSVYATISIYPVDWGVPPGGLCSNYLVGADLGQGPRAGWCFLCCVSCVVRGVFLRVCMLCDMCCCCALRVVCAER